MVINQVRVVKNGDLSDVAKTRLRLYMNPDHTTAHLISLHRVPKKHHDAVRRQALEIRSCLVQADEYFTAAGSTSLATRPVLLYYALVSLALAEILVKGTADSRLAKLREHHGAHGLSLATAANVGVTKPLLDIANSLRATPQFRRVGEPYGTFEVWRQFQREVPVPGLHEATDNIYGTRVQGVRALFIGRDIAPALESKGYTLHEAIQSLPELSMTAESLGLASSCVRATISASVDAKSTKGTMTISIHPADHRTLDKFYERILVEPSAINHITVKDMSSGMIISFPVGAPETETRMSFPPAVTVHSNQVHFLSTDWNLGEYGSYYIALSICGNLARYYPEIWMQHITQSTGLSLLIEELCSLAIKRLPVLSASEIDRSYYVKEGTDRN